MMEATDISVVLKMTAIHVFDSLQNISIWKYSCSTRVGQFRDIRTAPMVDLSSVSFLGYNWDSRAKH